MTRSVVLIFSGIAFTSPGCIGAANRQDELTGGARLFDGLGRHHRKVSTTSAEAQRFFDQGLVFAYAFNHDEAIRSFKEAARLDPQCAMVWWGVALCNGPHINNPIMDEPRSKAAWEAIQKAISLKDRGTPAEGALIEALAKRYASPPPTDRKPFDRAYAEAMRDVWRAHRGDTDVGTLTAEAMMDLRPWDLWTKDGRAQPGTEEIIATLEEVLSKDPHHPGANHLYIHTVEASPQPERGMAAADRLRDLVPAAGHLVHMPAHIDVRTGRWAEAAACNERAIAADREYRKLSPRQGFYHIYMAHNHHFLSYAAMMEGRSDAAIRAARNMIAGIPVEYVREQAALVDGYIPIAIEALMRFGRWDDLLRETAPPSHLPITTAFWHFARGVAHAAKNQVEDAQREQSAFRERVAKIPKDALMAINPAHDVLAIADDMLTGEIAFRRGSFDEAVAALREAVKREDALMYMEPPDWIQPVRHTLGAVLVHAGRYEEAEQVYRDDLRRWPENGWALYGLARCLTARGAAAEAEEVNNRFKRAWSRADVQIGSSCLCVAP